MLYLYSLLAAVAVTFTTVSNGPAVLYRGGPAVGGAVGVVLGLIILARSRPIDRVGPGIWPLAGLAAARVLSAAWHNAGWDLALAAVAAPVAYLVLARDPSRAAGILRSFGAGLAGVQLLQLGMGYLINRNLIAHALLICAFAYLDDRPRFTSNFGFWLVLAALITTLSKGGAIGLCAGLAVYAGRGWLAIPAAPVLAGGLWLLRPWRSAAWRLECWRRSLDAWASGSMLGRGPGYQAWSHHMAVHAHNGIINELLWDGVLGVVLVAGGIGAMLLESPRWARWQLAALVGVGAHYLVDDFTGCALCLALVAAVLAAGEKKAPPKRGMVSIPPYPYAT